MAIAGKVAIVPKGEWDNTTSYEKLDVVSYNNGTYIAKKASIGVIPVDGDTWMLAVKSIDATEFEKIIDGTTVVGKATRDSDGNIITDTYSTKSELQNHIDNTNNPHNVTAEQIGLGNVDNTADSQKSVNYATTAGTADALNSATANLENVKTYFTEATTRENINSEETCGTLFGKIKKWLSDLKSVAFSGSASDLTTGTLASDRLPSATSSALGGVKTTDSSAVTDSTGLALAATEKNASISGTLANQISTLNNNLDENVNYLTKIWTQANIGRVRFSAIRRSDGNEHVTFTDINTTSYLAFVLTETGDILIANQIISSSQFHFYWDEGKGNIAMVIICEY